MINLINIFLRTILVLLVLFIIAKIIGKKQVSQFNLFDYIMGITIGSIAADISLDLEKSLLSGIFAIILYGSISYIISIITMKSITMRRIFNEVPTILIEEGNIIEEGLKKVKIDINELLSQARINGFYNIEEINYAIMELNGSISFLPNEKDNYITKKDMNIKSQNKGIKANIIIDGKYMNKNIKSINKTKKWIEQELSKTNIKLKDILLATCDKNGQIKIYKKDIKSNNGTLLE